MVRVFVAIHFQIPIHLYQSSLTTRSFCVIVISPFSLSVFFSFYLFLTLLSFYHLHHFSSLQLHSHFQANQRRLLFSARVATLLCTATGQGIISCSLFISNIWNVLTLYDCQLVLWSQDCWSQCVPGQSQSEQWTTLNSPPARPTPCAEDVKPRFVCWTQTKYLPETNSLHKQVLFKFYPSPKIPI